MPHMGRGSLLQLEQALAPKPERRIMAFAPATRYSPHSSEVKQTTPARSVCPDVWKL